MIELSTCESVQFIKPETFTICPFTENVLLYHSLRNMQVASLNFRRKISENLSDSGLEETSPPTWMRMVLKNQRQPKNQGTD